MNEVFQSYSTSRPPPYHAARHHRCRPAHVACCCRSTRPPSCRSPGARAPPALGGGWARSPSFGAPRGTPPTSPPVPSAAGVATTLQLLASHGGPPSTPQVSPQGRPQQHRPLCHHTSAHLHIGLGCFARLPHVGACWAGAEYGYIGASHAVLQ
jgi:hypothetical protein